jgi:hypothetical protein
LVRSNTFGEVIEDIGKGKEDLEIISEEIPFLLVTFGVIEEVGAKRGAKKDEIEVDS